MFHTARTAKQDMDPDIKSDYQHVEVSGAAAEHLAAEPDPWKTVRQDADAGEEDEHRMTLTRLRKSPCFIWGGIAALSIIMEGYDLAVLGAFISLPQYRERFGDFYPDINQWQIPAEWQVGFALGPSLGNWIGIPLGALIIDKLGYRKTLLIFYFTVIPLIAIQTFAINRPMLLIGGILMGIPFGVFSTLACAYASEITPLALRPYLTGWICTCWVVGIFIGNGVVNGTLVIPGEWAFRSAFATQWAWPIPLIIGMYFAPESPWWLVRHGRLEEAEKSVKRLAVREMRDRSHLTVAQMVRTNQLEIDVAKSTQAVSPTWRDLFRGVDLRRTEIACLTFTAHNLCGDPFAGNIVYFFQQAGIDDIAAFRLGLGNYAVIIVANLISYGAMARFGRRTLYVQGLAWMTLCLMIIGGLGVIGDQGNINARWGIAALIYIWNFIRSVTNGPVCYAIVNEASSTRLRNKSVAAARICYILSGVIFNTLTPYMLNPSQWAWGAKTGFLWGPICLLCFVWAYFRLPEFKGRSHYDIDILFQRRISARKFSSTLVEVGADEDVKREIGQ